MRRARPSAGHRALVALSAVSILAGGVLAAAGPAQARSSSVALASGVVLTHSTFTLSGHKESVWTVTVDLNAHNQLVSTSPSRLIGTTRADLLSMAKQERGIAGINGDTLYYVDPTNQPRSGVMWQTHTLKAPLDGQDAILYTTTANRAYIGNPGFYATITIGAHKPRGIATINSLESAKGGPITLTTRAELSRPSMKTVGNAQAQKVTPSCSRVEIAPTRVRAQYEVVSFRTKLSSYTRVAPGHFALFTCGQDGKDYLASQLKIGSTLSLSSGYKVRGLVSMVAGVRKLIAGGKAWNDTPHRGLNDLGPYLLPESFTCLTNGGSRVIMGAVDGRTKGAAGMTYAMLTKYLLGLHCASAMANSGSSDTQLVARRPGKALAYQNHLTYKVGSKPNGLVDGLIVVRK